MPHVQDLSHAADQMSREEVSAMGSARREEVRRQFENSERLKANPLLYLVSPQVKVSLCFLDVLFFYFIFLLYNYAVYKHYILSPRSCV